MKKFIPKVIFTLPSAEEEAKTLAMFCVPLATGWDWSGTVIKDHPRLQEMIKESKDEKFIKKQCLIYATSCLKRWEKQLIAIKNSYQIEWDKINSQILNTLSDHFETEWPEDKTTIRATISICPIYPRQLHDYSFNVNASGNVEFSKRITCHELIHLLYFKKWKEVFPNTKSEEMEAPYLVWKLSEVMDAIIMNNHPVLKSLISMRSQHYKEFENLEVEGKKLLDIFEDLYIDYLNNNKPSFEDFFKSIWEVALKYRNIFEKS